MSDYLSDTERDVGTDYNYLLELEEMESLLEDLEEFGPAVSDFTKLPIDLAVRARSVGAANLQQLRDQIAALHTRLDAEDLS